MKILFNHDLPFLLARGGIQTQIEQTKAALERLGIEVEWLRWWDDGQRGDVIHFFGATPTIHLRFARAKGIPLVMTVLFTETCNRSAARLRRQGFAVRILLALPFGEGVKEQLSWRSFLLADSNVVGLEVERRVLDLVYHVPRERTAIVPLGLSASFLQAGAGLRSEPHLICVGTITERKNCVPLAQLARRAEVPVLFVGSPYAESDPYWKEFSGLIDGRCVRHHPHVADEAQLIALLQAARGAVVMSRYENWCLAAHEAAACGLPLLVPDLPWSRECFGDEVRYFKGNLAADVQILRRFHADCPQLRAPANKLVSWEEVAVRLRDVYARVLANCASSKRSVVPAS
jgi:glycosyltransferase involved in cell wall biosynthesis